jgi:hypothetical protein
MDCDGIVGGAGLVNNQRAKVHQQELYEQYHSNKFG